MKSKRKQTRPPVSVPIAKEARFAEIVGLFPKGLFSQITILLWELRFGTHIEKEIAKLKLEAIERENGL